MLEIVAHPNVFAHLLPAPQFILLFTQLLPLFFRAAAVLLFRTAYSGLEINYMLSEVSERVVY